MSFNFSDCHCNYFLSPKTTSKFGLFWLILSLFCSLRIYRIADYSNLNLEFWYTSLWHCTIHFNSSEDTIKKFFMANLLYNLVLYVLHSPHTIHTLLYIYCFLNPSVLVLRQYIEFTAIFYIWYLTWFMENVKFINTQQLFVALGWSSYIESFQL